MQTLPTQEPTPASGPDTELAQAPWPAPDMPEPLEETENFPLWLHSGG